MGSRAAPDLRRFLRLGGAVRSLQSGNRHLGANHLEAAFHGVPHAVFDLGKVIAARVRVGERSHTRAPAQQLIDRHAGALALDVPQRHVDAGERRHLHRAAPPVRPAIEVLPDILDGFRVAPDQQRRNVLFQVRRHGKFTPVERGVAHSVKPRLAGHDLHQHVVAARAGDDDAHVGNLQRRQARRGSARRRLTPSRSSRQSGLGERRGSGKFQESPAVPGSSFGGIEPPLGFTKTGFAPICNEAIGKRGDHSTPIGPKQSSSAKSAVTVRRVGSAS